MIAVALRVSLRNLRNTSEGIQVGIRRRRRTQLGTRRITRDPFEKARQVVLMGGTTHPCEKTQQEINIILDINAYLRKYPRTNN